jgi:hypothetical protein
MLLRLPLTESSAKVRTGWPADDEQDYDLSIWAGVVPFTHRAESPIGDPALRFMLDPPDYVVHYQRLGRAADAPV